MKRLLALLAILMLTLSLPGALSEQTAAKTPREDFIDRMLTLAKQEFDAARGRPLRAAYAGDRYVCKNFTVYLFRANRDAFRMAEFPETGLVIPDNLPARESKPTAYGAAWIDVPAGDGNPFYAAAAFRYDAKLSKKENQQLARDFLRQARRGDFFQMAANYYYGVGAHSLVFTRDYDAQADTLTWTDSNMKGKNIDGVRHGYIQYDAVKDVDWFVDAFCRKNGGATLYRLRDDIVYAP